MSNIPKNAINSSEYKAIPEDFYGTVGFSAQKKSLKDEIPRSNPVSKVLARFVTWCRVFFQPDKQLRSIEASLLDVYEAEEILEKYEADADEVKTKQTTGSDGQVLILTNHDTILKAREAFIKAGFQLGGFKDIGIITAHNIVNSCEWHKRALEDKTSYTNIQRSYKEESEIRKNPQKAQEAEDLYDRLLPRIHQKFYEFRKKLVEHQNSVISVLKGVSANPELVDSYKQFLQIWNDLVSNEEYEKLEINSIQDTTQKNR